MRNNTWRRVQDIPYIVLASFKPGIFLNGVIHWVASPQDKGTKVVVAFDLEEERFCEFPQPDYDNAGSSVLLKDGLILLSYASNDESLRTLINKAIAKERFEVTTYVESLIPLGVHSKANVALVHEYIYLAK
ncbi:hypothetical protein IFM89_013732 [Coptis chinensis]|uniref:F-box associated beta-propeller type 1 domain-containing protein n=1 Tax=Coptis chinensis TaxID=261450 RepID=A0A835LU75_9MAGN|nr:hypothetical protein IFM89_013732 [Coptis chinensis]